MTNGVRTVEWNLDDPTQFVRVLALELPWATTWADMTEGKRDRDKRERLRQIASTQLAKASGVKWWAFRIAVRRKKRGGFDVENVAKTIIDSFCGGQMHKDDSAFPSVELYPDDNVDHVRILRVYGERAEADATTVEVFGYVGGSTRHPQSEAIGGNS